jgi:hypothetical protein
MKNPPTEPLRGEAAWRANKIAIAKRNEEARARECAARATREAKMIERGAVADRLEASNLPVQPHPS